ncbi:MAG: glycosyltransferase [Planctomycetes bacterium]|nr:glycosyltransferase [Planctomycetota bacterium]
MPQVPAPATLPLFVVDASEWFHDPALQTHLSARHWRRLERRAATAIAAILPVLDRAGRKATFCVPGELAHSAPALVRDLVAAGHGLALAVAMPTPLDQLPPSQRAAQVAEWQRQRTALASVGGREVRGLAIGGVIGNGERWWRTPAAEAGFSFEVGEAEAHVLAHGAAMAGDGGPQSRDVVRFLAWRLDPGQPQLRGLPRPVFAAHYGQLARASVDLSQALAATQNGVVGVALGLPSAAVGPAAAIEAPAPATLREPLPTAVRLAVVVPLKDEEAGLGALFAELDQVRALLGDELACEFVCVDDGSRDRTWELLQQHAATRPFVCLVQHAQNLGVAAAIRTGLQASDAEFAASIDGDLSYDPMELRAMFRLLQERAATVVTASPYHRHGGVRNVPKWRLSLSRTLSALYRRLTGAPLATWTACFRVYRRAFVAELPLTHPGFLGTAELLVRVLRRGGVVAEHPCVLEARLFGFSKMKVLRTIRQHLGLLRQVARGCIR